MKKIGFLRKSPTYGNDCDYSNVSETMEWSLVVDSFK